MNKQSKIKTTILFYLTIMCCFPTIAFSESQTEKTGTILQMLIPTFALGYSAYIKDYEGCKQLFKASGSAAIITEVLKRTVKAERPYQEEGVDGRSFPSGHTSFAFSCSAYLQRRYGYKFGVPAYLAASYVGYSRVHSNKHHWADVIAGAAVGIGFNYLFTTPYNDKYDISVNADTDKVICSVAFKF